MKSVKLLTFLIFYLCFQGAWASDFARKAYTQLLREQNNPSEIYKVLDNKDSAMPTERVWLLIQGFNLGDGKQWMPVFDLMAKNKISSYFHRISTRDSLDSNMKSIQKSILALANDHPETPITVVAYSASGAAALLAYHQLKRDASLDKKLKRQLKQSELYTVASPMRGYDVPLLAMPFIHAFVGPYTAQLAKGMQGPLKNVFVDRCFHFINTDCAKDKHVCAGNTGQNGQTLPTMPCSAFNIEEMNYEHGEILVHAVEEIINQYQMGKTLLDREIPWPYGRE